MFVRRLGLAATAVVGAAIMLAAPVSAAETSAAAARPSDDVSIAACGSLSVSKPTRSGSEVLARVRAGACSSSTWVSSAMYRDGSRFDSYSKYGNVDVYLRVACMSGRHYYYATISASGASAENGAYITC
ncbi:hypothetical protein [Saccharothrix sp. NRRL B-16348]|uniref:hypothetical protein n=1 Tax=Saccharothrix sp. NRRL B-16348 TaxID=1415542 RepID=UPI000A9C4E99|nr:hypothetical protein [Saccharothrix sp. NRRL B-16348]